MQPNAPIHFIYTPYLAVSHITIVREEPEVLMFGLYGNLLNNEMQELILQCEFTQINDLLHLADYIADETIEQLADIVSADFTEPQTIDITDKGGINFNDLLFCLEPVLREWKEEDVMPQERHEYYLHAFFKKDKSIPAFEVLPLAVDMQSRANYYLRVLSVQYDFYLHFINQKMKTDKALYLAQLQDQLIFSLAKTAYELREGIGCNK